MNYEQLVERARQRPDSTEAIGLIAIQQAMYQKQEERKQKVHNFFKRLVGKSVD